MKVNILKDLKHKVDYYLSLRVFRDHNLWEFNLRLKEIL